MNNPYSSLKTNNRFTLFVNSETPPDSETPLDHYYYVSEKNGYRFFRLYRLTYVQQEDGVGVKHSLYDWREVKVKEYCHAALKQFCDSLKSVEAFLVDPASRL